MAEHLGHNLLDLEHLDAPTIRALARRARQLREQPEPVLAGRAVATMFFENSTRTRVSFTHAAQKLGASVVDLNAAASSQAKGESLLDTARTISAMGVHAMVVRHAENGAPGSIAEAVRCPVLNAGDGTNEHPTQALADALTIADSVESARDLDFSSLRIAIVGDVLHSRVARSNAWGLTKLGAHVTLVGPEAMAPGSLADELPVAVSHNLEALLPQLDAVMMLRVQLERGTRIDSPEAYRDRFGLTADRAASLSPGCLIMHPGPMNRGVEIDPEAADGHAGPGRPVIWDQVASGVAVRMAALESCILSAPPSISGQTPTGRATVSS